MSSFKTQIFVFSVLDLILLSGFCFDLGFATGTTPSHDHHHHHHHHHHHDHNLGGHQHTDKKMLLPEELAEEEDMRLYGFGPYHHDHDHDQDHHVGDLQHVGFVQGKPSKAVVDSLALFGAGAMLGDAFLHQLPHAFGGEHSHSHDHHEDHTHQHSHSLKDLSVGISVLVGIVLFLLVEKLVRYVDENSGETDSWGHGHHHHHHNNTKLKNDDDINGKKQSQPCCGIEEKGSNQMSEDSLNRDSVIQQESLRRRKTSSSAGDDKSDVDAIDSLSNDPKSLEKKEPAQSSNLVFGYLNLFSDGVHNFTDGMALGSAFLLYGSVGGWSRTLFLLAHELPQEVGDFGILVRSGFSVSKALFFNFLSALVALAGTAMALLWGQDPGQSSLIEGFTAGGFIYVAVAGVLAEMNNNGNTALKSTAVQLTSLILGMCVALCISLVE
ncbi:IAA-alanine resistance protein 1-like isoform X2 [Mangifera indica]|uniref:IAA-alanine resistance protein 1-like isoform X2 n=1 Tax=Mangifera indica TaxID=29780 RepID=UPI001CFBE580|nr:IAA-alanine resistance protein 1-like isoform X2 [Mangifera indica]